MRHRLAPAVAVWAALIGTGLGWNAYALHHDPPLPALCHAARNRLGFAIWAGFGLHLFIRFLDPVRLTASLYRRYIQ